MQISRKEGGETMKNSKVQNEEVTWSDINREESELACLGDMCSWKEAD